jgi:glycosyltransferase involved in cell wall biosynthesis
MPADDRLLALRQEATMKRSPRVLHVITGLRLGGAETLLVRLLEGLGDERRGHSVLSLRPRWPLAQDIEELGVPVQALGMSGRPTPADIFRLGRILRRSQADLIQTWMLHSNVLGVVSRAVSRSPIVWGVHLSEVSRSTLGTKAVVVQRLEATCSWFVPSRIVACSVSSRQVMHRLGYRRRRIVTIPNGFDVARFSPDPGAREEVRRELGLSPTTTAVGHLARFHPIKDHATLLAAAREVVAQAPDVRFVLCGHGVDAGNPELSALAAPLGDRVQLLGRRDDVPRLLNAFDLAVSSSSGEALPLAIGEAMSTGIPVAATRCGDSEELIADTGALAPVGDPTALAQAMLGLIETDPETRSELGRRARARISSRYSLQGMVEGYQSIWAELGPASPSPD